VKPASSISALAARAEELVLSDTHLGVGLVELDLARRIEVERGPVESSPGRRDSILPPSKRAFLNQSLIHAANHFVNSA
jgi:hypothetical protein